jgi:sugar phosphate isomerase/epimerase
MELPRGLGRLAYCTNIHPGEDWPAVRRVLAEQVPAVKANIAPAETMGVGLRLAAVAAEALDAPEALVDLQGLLRAHDLDVFTLNGFPYGPFHGTAVKAQVYQPDWRRDDRLVYANRLADILAALLPADGFGTVSTVPGTFKPLAAGHEADMAARLIEHVAHLVELRARTGRTVAVALEPEPCCFLETIAEAIDFFERYLFADAAVERLADGAGLGRGEARDALPRHLGLCYDVCHAAVEWEDPAASFDALAAAGVPVHKLQLSAALRLDRVSPEARAALAAFDEPTYLHQVVARAHDGTLRRHLDLPDALARGAAADGEAWRVHFHVPIFIDTIAPFATTQDFLRAVLARHRERPIAPHLEVETYTFDVLPEVLRDVAVESAVARELRWVVDELAR